MHCPICGFENKPGARFCAQCGAALQDEPRRLAPGERVGKGAYRILRTLGEGGMGAVYLAANTRAFDRPCVVKEVIEYYDRHDPGAREKAMAQFEREARTLAALKHPGIPDVYAYFTEGGRNFLVIEYIEGKDLSRGLDGEALPVEGVVRHATQICDVLVYLAGREPPVVHNDIKPGNIILDQQSGRAVLVDFGTAQSRYARPAGGAGPAGEAGPEEAHLYATTGYAAPELYEGKAEPRSDVYALAATVYHLLTGDDPRAHPFQYPELERIDAPLREVLAAALKADVAQRIDAAEFKARLHAVPRALETELQLARRATPRRKLFAFLRQQPARREAVKLEPAHPQPAKLQMTAPPEPEPDHAELAVRLGPADVEVTPPRIELGRVGDRGRYVDTAILMVRNRAQGSVAGRLEEIPAWLAVVPERWTCAPGQTRPISLQVRADGAAHPLVQGGSQLGACLRVLVNRGARSYPVQVHFLPRIAPSPRRQIVRRAVVAGAITLTLAALAAWFVLAILPLL